MDDRLSPDDHPIFVGTGECNMTTTLIAVSLGWGAVLAAGAWFASMLFPSPTDAELSTVEREPAPVYDPMPVSWHGSLAQSVVRATGRFGRHAGRYVGRHVRRVVAETVTGIRSHRRGALGRLWPTERAENGVEGWLSDVRTLMNDYVSRHSPEYVGRYSEAMA